MKEIISDVFIELLREIGVSVFTVEDTGELFELVNKRAEKALGDFLRLQKKLTRLSTRWRKRGEIHTCCADELSQIVKSSWGRPK